MTTLTDARPANPVEYTISQDRGAGNTAQVEAGYALLAGKDFGLANVLVHPGQQQQDTVGHNDALQDYQMQLMLLEQQNKKRLLMARQEQDSIRDMSLARRFDEFGGGPGTDSEDQESVTEDNQESSQDSDQDSRPGEVNPKMKRKRNFDKFKTDRSLELAIKNDSDTCTKSQERPKRPRNEAIEAYSVEPQAEHPDHLVLYRVICSDNKVRCHRRIYQDEPQRVPTKNSGSHHLCGNKPIPDLDNFLRGFPRAAFIVYRDCFCEKGHKSSFLGANSSNPSSKFFREIISVVSEELHTILQESSMFAPNHEAYKIDRYESDHLEASQALSASPSEYSHRFLYHHRQILGTKAACAPDGSPIKALVSYMQSHPDPMYQKCDDLFSRGMVTQETLPWLFFPNQIVVSSEGPLHIAYVVRRVPMEGSTLRLLCWNWGYDGHWLHRKDNTLPVQTPSYGEVRIDTLALYPQGFAAKAVTEGILENGRKFWRLSRQVLASYEGLDYQGERTYPCDSRFMIDYQVYSKFHGLAEAFNFSKKERAAFDLWPENISRHESLSEVQLMLLPSGIHGFYLKEKKWMHLLVKNIQPVNWNKTAFEQLVLPKRTKNLVKGLVMVRKQTLEDSELQIGLKGKRDDIIAGKGSGLIMLLHGGPGTGKTLTAAELAEMPLYSVTCGDIGTSPEAVEKYLNSVLYLGKKWNCVLLLDEADVFLEERSLSDLERNSLVSVFLRTLEYYDGVLILTSNRVGTFDEAFKSRIQLALHYPPLDAPGRRKIWHNFLNMLQSNDEKADIDDIKAHMDELAGYELNGRQIRNALTTARQLSLFEQETLDWDRVKDSIEVAGDFTKYIKEVHGHTDEEWSRDNNLR